MRRRAPGSCLRVNDTASSSTENWEVAGHHAERQNAIVSPTFSSKPDTYREYIREIVVFIDPNREVIFDNDRSSRTE